MAKFTIGDQVLVVIGEGLDTPPRAQGKTGTIIGYIGESEYTVEMPDGLTFSAAFYHILPIPEIQNFTSARHIVGIIRENDPDLYERIRQISDSHYRLRDFSDATTIFVLAWLGVQVIDDDPRCLEGSGVHEML